MGEPYEENPLLLHHSCGVLPQKLGAGGVLKYILRNRRLEIGVKMGVRTAYYTTRGTPAEKTA